MRCSSRDLQPAADAVAAIDPFDALAVEAQHAVESAQLHAFNAGVLVGQTLQYLHVEFDLVIELAAHQPLEQANAAGRAGVARLREGEGEERRLAIVDRHEEDVQAPADLAFLAGGWALPPVIVDGVDRREI